jgi:predicted Zn-dependent protease
MLNNKWRKYHLLTLLLLLITINGCVKDALLSTLTKPFEEDAAPLNYLSDLNSIDSSSQEDAITSNIENDIAKSRLIDRQIIKDPVMDNYINGILSKLLETVSYPHKSIRVFIVSDEGYNAVSLENGGIFIPIDTLINIRSEDELAAIIAHEASHILLEHHVSNHVKDISNRALSAMNKVMIVSGKFSSESELTRAYKTIAAEYILENALFPAWDRKTEENADSLGLDLLVNAGYSAEGMFEFQKRVGLQNSLDGMTFSERFEKNLPKDLPSSGFVDESIEMLIKASFNSLNSTITETHKSSEKRFEASFNYLNEHYSHHSFPALKKTRLMKNINTGNFSKIITSFIAAKVSARQLDKGDVDIAIKNGLLGISGKTSNNSYNRLNMYNLRLAQNKTNKAVKNLDLAIASGDATYSVYIAKYRQLIAKNQLNKAKSFLSEIEKEFNLTDQLLPYKIDLERRENDETQAQLYYAQCFVTSTGGSLKDEVFKEGIKTQCDNAIRGQFI